MSGVGARIQAKRKEKKLTLSDLGRESKVSVPYLSQLERGERDAPSADILYRIATVLGVTMADLLDDPVPPLQTLEHLPLDLPESLRQFVEQRGEALEVRSDDVRMLASIRYRGRQPQSVNDWEDLFRFIRKSLSHGG